jgi:hypothetical protein
MGNEQAHILNPSKQNSNILIFEEFSVHCPTVAPIPVKSSTSLCIAFFYQQMPSFEMLDINLKMKFKMHLKMSRKIRDAEN